MGATALIERLDVENLRGFKRISLDLTRRTTFLVGPNNAGKTSLLRILDWSLNGADGDLLEGRRQLTEQETTLLMPASDAAGRARRVTLTVRVSDLRVARRYQARDGLAILRLKVSGGRVSAHLGRPTRGEPIMSDERALQLLELVRASEQILYIPNVRDTSSGPFRERLRAIVFERLRGSMLHEAPGRPSARARTVRESLDSLRETAEGELADVIATFSQESQHLFERAELHLSFTPDDALGWLADAVALRLTTGTHDRRMVSVDEVGSGLQSLLVIGLLKGLAESGIRVRLLLEEPETFLHPSAQRELARSLLDNKSLWFVASTHSAAMLDEASVSDVVIVRGHRLYQGALVGAVDERQSAFMSGPGAEALFARSILLVEGAGDAAVFEQWRRRIAGQAEFRGACSQLAVIPVGGKTNFTPWIKLFRGFVDQERRPALDWLVLGDGDAAAQVIKCLNLAGVEVAESVRAQRADVDSTYASKDQLGHERSVIALNRSAMSGGVRMHLIPFDLEYSLCRRMSASAAELLADRLSLAAGDGEQLAHRLGSKCRTDAYKRAPKGDAIRREIARQMAMDDLHPEMLTALQRWLEPVVGSLPVLPNLGAGD